VNTIDCITPFDLTWQAGDTVLVPPHLLDDIKSRKDDEVNNLAALDIVSVPTTCVDKWRLISPIQLVQKRYTNLDSTSEMMNHLVKSDLTTSLSE
jgi:hypothetical protein